MSHNRYPTYIAASTQLAPGATPEDVLTISGSATHLIKVHKMSIATIQTTSGTNPWFVTKRSTANSGGTSAAVTAVPVDSGTAAATASVLQYTSAPTSDGTLVGTIWSGTVPSPAPAALGAIGGIEFNIETLNGSDVVLKDTSESIGWNFNGAALPTGMVVNAWVVWSELSKT
jgi:hypothetical protein